MFQGERFFAAAVDSCVRGDFRGIMLTRHAEHVPRDLPADVIHVDYAPFSELLPRVAALVHHGGIGTSAQGMAAGVPQLVTTITHDQPDNAHRMKRLGVAETIPMSKFSGRRGARLINTLFAADRLRANCRAVADRFKTMDGLGQTCDLLESLATQRRADRPAATAAT
jgi:UDP:flavonoid glycosyltransferase YjiC (YdhE family)